MGKAQKLKKLRKQEKIDRERKSAERSKITLITVLTVILVILGGFWLNDWYQKRMADANSADQAIIHTNMGDITVALFSDKAPKTVENFIGLAKSGYYNGTSFHRVIPDFMIQGGDSLSRDDDPTNDGTGGESIWGGKFEDEINPWSLGLDEATISALQDSGYVYRNDLQSEKMTPGVIAMANSGPNTNGSQFFIVTSQDQPHLDGRHTVFGRVLSGMDVVDQISRVETDENDRPLQKVEILSVELIKNANETIESDQSLPITVEPVETDTSTGVEISDISFE